MPALSWALLWDCAHASKDDTDHSRGGAVKSFWFWFFQFINLYWNDWTDGASTSTTDCGRLFHTSLDWYTNNCFRMFNRHLSLIMVYVLCIIQYDACWTVICGLHSFTLPQGQVLISRTVNSCSCQVKILMYHCCHFWHHCFFYF